jgi:hypothetical protein
MAKLTFDETCEVLGYGPWNKTDPKYGEFVRIKFDSDAESRRYTIPATVDRPIAGTRVTLHAESKIRHDAKVGSDGEPYVVSREQIRVIALALAA